MALIIGAGIIAALLGLTFCTFIIGSEKPPKKFLISIGILLVIFVLWSAVTYPNLELEVVQLKDYGVITSITPSGGKGPVMFETSSGSLLKLYPEFPCRVGDSVEYRVRFEGGRAEYYYLIGGKPDEDSFIEWNMPGWSKALRDYPEKRKLPTPDS